MSTQVSARPIDITAPGATRVERLISTAHVNRSNTMYLMQEELARSRMQERREQARSQVRASRLASARRWQRRAEASARRARAAREALL